MKTRPVLGSAIGRAFRESLTLRFSVGTLERRWELAFRKEMVCLQVNA
jgi:hypothetical protein